VLIAHDLICWTQRLLLTGELARVEPKRLRYRLLHVAARLAFHARTATLRLQATWPWPANSPPPSSASKRSPPQPAKTGRPGPHDDHASPATAPREPCPRTALQPPEHASNPLADGLNRPAPTARPRHAPRPATPTHITPPDARSGLIWMRVCQGGSGGSSGGRVCGSACWRGRFPGRHELKVRRVRPCGQAHMRGLVTSRPLFVAGLAS